MTIKIIDVAGLKKSGKTTVVEHIVRELSARGHKVGTLKKIHIPGFTLDQPGKDTYRHKQAGADFVISLAPEEVALLKNHHGQRVLSEVWDLMPADTDFLVCEELNELRDDILYIVTLAELDKLPETLSERSIGTNIIALSGVFSNEITAHDKYPVINATTPAGGRKLVDLILEKSE